MTRRQQWVQEIFEGLFMAVYLTLFLTFEYINIAIYVAQYHYRIGIRINFEFAENDGTISSSCFANLSRRLVAMFLPIHLPSTKYCFIS